MPVNGLPTILECVINKILEESELESFKIAGNPEKSTIVLRFGSRIDTSVSMAQHSTPASFRRKAPSQIKRDKIRQERHRASIQPNNVEILSSQQPETPSSHRKNNVTDINMKFSKPSSPIITTKNSNRSENVLDDTLQDNSTITHVSKSIDSQYHSDNNNTNKCETSYFEEEQEHAEKTQSDLHNQLVFNSQAITRNNIRHGEEIEDDTVKSESDELTHTCPIPDQNIDNSEDDTVDSENYSEHSIPDQHIVNSDDDTAAESECSKLEHSRESNHKDESNHLLNDFRRRDKIMMKIFDIKNDIREHITKPDRNTEIKKIFLDTFEEKGILLAETDDIIIEYCIENKKIMNFTTKGQQDSPYAKMRLRHVLTWKDETQYIQEQLPDEVLHLMVELPVLKRCIKEPI